MDIYIDEGHIFEEHVRKKETYRKSLEHLLSEVLSNDRIICNEIGELAKTANQLCELAEVLTEKKCVLLAGDILLDFCDDKAPQTIGMLKMVGVLKQIEHRIKSQSVKRGIAEARKKGKALGRPNIGINDIPKSVIENYGLLEQGALSKTDCAKLCNISRPTLNKYLEIMKTPINENID